MSRSLLIIISISLLLSSCVFNKKQKVKVIGVSQCSDDPWRKTMNDEILREASFYPDLQIKMKTAYDSNQKQIRDIESFIAEGVDLLVVAPNEAVPLTPVIEKAMKEGIPVILVDRKISTGLYTAFVGADNYQIGKEVGVYAANCLKGKGTIAEIRGLEGSTPSIDRHNGFMSIIKNYPGIQVVFQDHAEWLRKNAKEKMKKALDNGIQVDLVFAHNDEMANGVHDALSVDVGAKKPILIGIDALPTASGGIQRVLDGVLDATFIYPTGGDKVVQTAVKILDKEHFDKENILYTAVVDKTNARVLKLQTDQIIHHQNRINDLNVVLDKNLTQYSTQRQILFATFATLLLIMLLVFLLFRSLRLKNKANNILEQKNRAINKQKEELSEQRDQLITLSKNLEEATQAKLVFFTNISHEFRTPITLLHGPLETIAKNEHLSQDGSRLVQIMRKNVLVLMRLIDQIIEFRKYENGKMQAQFTLGNLKSFIDEACDSFIELSHKKHIHFTFSATDDDFTVWFDSEKMEEICYNLFSNAIKYTPEKGRISVHLSKEKMDDESYAVITVLDTGIGISEQHINQIFDRFFRIDQTVSGSGLGLALTKVLVELHKGRIDVKSTVGKGSEFKVSIPFKQKDIAISEKYPTLTHFANRDDTIEFYEDKEDDSCAEHLENGKTLILLVEDNADVRLYIKSLLKDDYDIIEANNGQSGLYKAMKYVPEVIISDVMMDVMDGFELCKQIKENLTTSHISVVLLTACTQDEQRVIGYNSGADSYLSKPFNESVLKTRIKKILENRERVKAFFQQNLTFGVRKEIVTEIDKNFIDRFRAIVYENLVESDLNVDEIGKNMGLSRVQLYRKIKSLTNYAPNELVRNIRLKAAEQLMLNSEKNISEIAYETGFSSPSYFTKCFKEYFNESPTEHQKKSKNFTL